MPSKSGKQRRFMGAALAEKRSGRAASPKIAKAASSMSERQLRDFARSSKRTTKRSSRKSSR